MGVLRVSVTAVLMLATAVSAAGQCVSETLAISSRRSVPNLVAGPPAWGNGVLAVAKTDTTNNFLFVATYDHNFTPLSGDRLIATDAQGDPLALVFNGAGFGLFYRTGDERLVLQRLSLGGEPIGTPIPVTSRTFDHREEVDVTWSDVLGAYAIVATYESRGQVRVWVTVMTRDGLVQRDVDTFVFGDPEESSVEIAVTADGTIGAFVRTGGDQTIGAIRLPRNTTIVAADTIWTAGRDLEVVALGNRFYLVKSVEPTPGQREMRWLVYDSAGHIVRSDALLARVPDLDLQPAALITNGQELALSYLERPVGFDTLPNFRLRRFTPAGDLIGDALFSAASPPNRFASSPYEFVWTGAAYITTAVFTDLPDLDSYLIRYCPLRVSIAADRHLTTNDDFVTFTAVPEGGAPGYAYFWNPSDSSTTSVGPTFRYRFTKNGTFTVTLTVVDASGVATSTTHVIQVVSRKTRAVRK